MTFGVLKTRTFERLDDPPDGSGYYTVAEVAGALNAAQRVFAYLTLCLEATRKLDLAPNLGWYHLLDAWSDFLVVLRVRLSTLDPAGGGDALFDAGMGDTAVFDGAGSGSYVPPAAPKLRPARLADLRALDSGWMGASGQPQRYAMAGCDLLLLDRTPAEVGPAAYVTIARSPVPMTADDGTPEIPATHHEALIEFALFWLRAKEGGSEFAETIPALGRFLDAAKQAAAFVRARSLALRYDQLPIELERFDLSRLLKIRRDLPKPGKEAAPSPSQQAA